ncbi:hypothetical protein [Rudaeicoccus suwonensis]|uniref:ATP/GTP-binding protein n=1 Tax=Rudaeicoccus suwonensis TaxID=657409 RepID=A0A561DX64_9MICO|nr:hypothetical protein [Rudaeicoccus suwonensis]TWE07961.1 hypothetical protein BKA23_3328 [Rudaeicoccus suwonensis]
MPRRNRPRPSKAARAGGARPDISRVLETGLRTESYAGGSWRVREVRGNTAGRTYVCPGCQQALESAIAHVVVWPADGLGDVADRRHWHATCWGARDRRPPQGSWR